MPSLALNPIVLIIAVCAKNIQNILSKEIKQFQSFLFLSIPVISKSYFVQM